MNGETRWCLIQVPQWFSGTNSFLPHQPHAKLPAAFPMEWMLTCRPCLWDIMYLTAPSEVQFWFWGDIAENSKHISCNWKWVVMRLVDACGQSVAGLHEEAKRTELNSVPRIAQTAWATKWLEIYSHSVAPLEYPDFSEIWARQVHSTGSTGSFAVAVLLGHW